VNFQGQRISGTIGRGHTANVTFATEFRCMKFSRKESWIPPSHALSFIAVCICSFISPHERMYAFSSAAGPNNDRTQPNQPQTTMINHKQSHFRLFQPQHYRQEGIIAVQALVPV
jgi:hypothetical protein